MPTVPASKAIAPAGVDSAALVWAESVPGGGYASKRLAAGTRLRLADPDGEACAHVLLFHADEPWERLNVADTVKVPWQAYLGVRHPLLSDQGRVLATIVDDTSTTHDALCSTLGRRVADARYGDGAAHSATPAGHELFLLAAAKHGLSERDVPPSVSFFKGVRFSADGAARFEGAVRPGTHVEIRTELDVLLLVANVPHPLDVRAAYTCSTLEIRAWSGEPGEPDDPLAETSPEFERALAATSDFRRARS